MDNWLVTALTAAVTALGALVTGGAPVAHHAAGPAVAHVASPARPGPAPRAKDKRNQATAERPSRATARHLRAGHRRHHARSARHRPHRHAKRPSRHHSRHPREHHREHHRHRASHRPRQRHRAYHRLAHRVPRAHRHATATRGSTRSLVVRRAPLAAAPVLRHGVPLRRIMGIRHALGMRPSMGALGTDVSWPQCQGGLPMPLAAAQFVVVGLTDGPAFSANHCLRAQASWIRAHHRHVATYAVVSYPHRADLRRLGHRGPYSRRTLAGRLRNVGFQQARLNLRRMHGAGLHSPVLWIDLEPSSTHPWARRHVLNAAVVRGLVHGYRRAGQRIGFYSTALIWREIVGRLRFGAPEWRTAGPASPGAALGRCGERAAAIQGGPAVLAQWWNDRRDHDLLCPGSRGATAMAHWFAQP